MLSNLTAKATNVAKSGTDAATNAAKDSAVKVLESTCGRGTSDAMGAVCDMLGGLYKELYPGATYPVMVNAAMIFLQSNSEPRYSTPLVSGVPFRNPRVLEKASRYGLFANAAYKKTEAEVSQMQGLETITIHYFEKSNAVKFPNFFIAEDPLTDVIVLAIRGTASVSDALTDALCDEVEFLDGHAHGAIVENARNVIKNAKPVLLGLLKKWPERKVIVTGHSLGAGTAVLTTLELFSQASSDRIHKNALVECYAFAPPAVYKPSKEYPADVKIYSFINNMDCVPRFCLGTGVKFLLAVKEADQMSMGIMERTKFFAPGGPVPKEPKLVDYKEIPAELSAKYQSHHPAGTLIILYPQADDGSLCCEELKPEMLDRLLLTKSMVGDHSMGNYQKLLDEAKVKFSVSAQQGKDPCCEIM